MMAQNAVEVLHTNCGSPVLNEIADCGFVTGIPIGFHCQILLARRRVSDARASGGRSGVSAGKSAAVSEPWRTKRDRRPTSLSARHAAAHTHERNRTRIGKSPDPPQRCDPEQLQRHAPGKWRGAA